MRLARAAGTVREQLRVLDKSKGSQPDRVQAPAWICVTLGKESNGQKRA